jgi:hypothetical protein
MKKIFMITMASLFVIGTANAQTWAEWFQQKQTQKKYLLQQIAALQVYIGYANKGYDIANRGLNTIKDIKKGDFNLHHTFFNSLKNVNPKVKRYAKVANIVAYQLKIIKKSGRAISAIKSSGQLTTTEISYCNAVFNNLLDDCVKTIDELLLVTTSGTIEMKDDERLKRIDKLYTDMQDKYSFCSAFSSEINVLTLQRMNEHFEINSSKTINGIK